MSEYTYAWPASRLTPADMKILHDVRENHSDHLPISELVALAVRAEYGHLASQPEVTTKQERETSLQPVA